MRLRKLRLNRIRKSAFVDVLLVLVCAIMSQLGVSFHVKGQQATMVVVALCGFAVYMYSHSLQTRSLYQNIMIAAIPFALALAYTALVASLHNEFNLGIIPQAFTSTGFAFVQFMFAATIIITYRRRAIDIAYYIIVVSYLITIALVLCEHSVGDIISKYNTLYNYLERHDIGVSVVPVILLYVYQLVLKKGHYRNDYLKRIAVMCVIMLLNGKRSAYLSLAIGLFVMFVLTRSIKWKKKFCNICCLVLIVVLYGTVVMIQTGFLQSFLQSRGFSTIGRVDVWSHFNNQYNVTPLYLGKGFQYVHLYMSAYIAEGGSTTSMVSMFNYLHNSDLQIFIELGFWGFFLWFGFYLYFYPMRLGRKYGTRVYYLTVIMMTSMVAMYIVDNTLTYPVYQTTVYISIFSYILYENGTPTEKLQMMR